ncbi:hypothetical protein Q757_01405 [Oenococcus alcoholitolerans]|uniref:Uncharacterized protein n=1 Tax=Oenococcus alcoholitolerans TaxID=931074 RepID=A0ABR4XSB6_9LACO|nr:hypothetical protein Q757_01405 [Oenococcus alcoholitolerans]
MRLFLLNFEHQPLDSNLKKEGIKMAEEKIFEKTNNKKEEFFGEYGGQYVT